MIASIDHLPDVGLVTGGEPLAALRDEVVAFVADRVDRADAAGVVVPMSGGLDSTLTATLCVDALGPGRVFGLCLPAAGDDPADAESVAASLGIERATVDVEGLLSTFEEQVAPGISTATGRLAVGNALARFRMACAYYAANTHGSLVCGTVNRSDRLLGYFTKYGDGGADLFPLGECYKTEVRALARLAGVPTRIVEKPPSAGLWAGQTDREELGAPYGLVDVVLSKLVDEDLGIEGTAAELGVDPSVVERFARMHVESHHKRRLPPTPGDAGSDATHFHELEVRSDGVD